MEKAASPTPYMHAITACTVTDRFEGGLVRLDDRTVSISAVSIWHVDDAGLIDDYRVFFDLASV